MEATIPTTPVVQWKKREPILPINKDLPMIEQFAQLRGIDPSMIETFLSPTDKVLHDPFLLQNMDVVANRIKEHMDKNSQIVVSYDPDSDGICSGTIMVQFLRHYLPKENVGIIYAQRTHGHGIAEQMTLNVHEERKKISKQNRQTIQQADLLIIVDSSSNDVEACKQITSWGKEIIILDHHLVEVENPYVTLINPQQTGDVYPNKDLSGAGVVFKTIQAVDTLIPTKERKVDPWVFVDLVAVGIYGDVMDMRNLENRYLVSRGLQNIHNIGLTRLLKGAKADFHKLNVDTIGFTISPMLNGVTRLERMELAIDLFLAETDTEAKKLRLEMEKLNTERKEKQKEIVTRYSEQVDHTKKVIMIADEQSSKGFNGLVAQNLTGKYNKPTMVGRLHGGSFVGSFRSVGILDFRQLLKDSNLCLSVQGHAGAGGFRVSEENIPHLQAYLEEQLPNGELRPTYYYDIEVDLSKLQETIQALEQFNYLHGRNVPKILVKISDLTILNVQTIGKTQETRKFQTLEGVELIKFKVDSHYANELGLYDKIEVIGELSINEFFHFQERRTIRTNQVKIVDYRCISS